MLVPGILGVSGRQWQQLEVRSLRLPAYDKLERSPATGALGARVFPVKWKRLASLLRHDGHIAEGGMAREGVRRREAAVRRLTVTGARGALATVSVSLRRGGRGCGMQLQADRRDGSVRGKSGMTDPELVSVHPSGANRSDEGCGPATAAHGQTQAQAQGEGGRSRGEERGRRGGGVARDKSTGRQAASRVGRQIAPSTLPWQDTHPSLLSSLAYAPHSLAAAAAAAYTC